MNTRFLKSCLLILLFPSAVFCQRDLPAARVEKAFISFRLGTGLYLNEKRFDEVISLFNKYRGVTDEVTFFTSETHPPLPLEVFRSRMKILEKRMQTARRNGYRSGINVLSTIGHHEENLENSLHGDYTHVTDLEGKVSKGSYCPNDKNFQVYVGKIYEAMASANPDYIWIDDDIRLAGHLPVSFTCFCDQCLNVFEKEYGQKYTREALKTAFNEGDAESKLRVRSAWIQHNRNTIANLFKLIEQTVHSLKPGLPLGFMTGDRFFEGYDFANWSRVLAGKDNAPVMWRPGGGFYNDNITADLAGKSHDIGRQVSVLPQNVVSIQSEIENYTYQRLKKSANITALEAASHIAAGCTGAAFNVLTFNNEPLAEYEPLIEQLHQMRPFYNLLAAKLGRSALAGVSAQWNKDSYIGGNLSEGSWLSGGAGVAGYEIDEIGLPTSYSAITASVVKLKKDNINVLSKKEIEDLLSKGVYMDADALRQLNARGFGDLTGFEVSGTQWMDRIEKLTDHPLNGNFGGRKRDNRQSVYRSEAFTLIKTNEKAQILATLVNYQDAPAGDCSMGIFENRLGGRICVAGYYPWSAVHSLSKSSQMKSVFRWLSGDRLPGYVDSFHKINLWMREPWQGKTAMAFTNSSFDQAKNVVLMINTTHPSIHVYDMACKETVIRSAGKEGPYQRFVIPQVNAWEMRLVVTE
jgi:hypothetical protein